jgi:hypothetical protein
MGVYEVSAAAQPVIASPGMGVHVSSKSMAVIPVSFLMGLRGSGLSANSGVLAPASSKRATIELPTVTFFIMNILIFDPPLSEF